MLPYCFNLGIRGLRHQIHRVAVRKLMVRQYCYATGLVSYVRSLLSEGEATSAASRLAGGASAIALLDHERISSVGRDTPGPFKSLLSKPVPALFIRPFYNGCFEGPMASLKPGARYTVIGNEGSECLLS